MAKCNELTPLPFKGLTLSVLVFRNDCTIVCTPLPLNLWLNGGQKCVYCY